MSPLIQNDENNNKEPFLFKIIIIFSLLFLCQRAHIVLCMHANILKFIFQDILQIPHCSFFFTEILAADVMYVIGKTDNISQIINILLENN